MPEPIGNQLVSVPAQDIYNPFVSTIPILFPFVPSDHLHHTSIDVCGLPTIIKKSSILESSLSPLSVLYDLYECLFYHKRTERLRPLPSSRTKAHHAPVCNCLALPSCLFAYTPTLAIFHFGRARTAFSSGPSRSHPPVTPIGTQILISVPLARTLQSRTNCRCLEPTDKPSDNTLEPDLASQPNLPFRVIGLRR